MQHSTAQQCRQCCTPCLPVLPYCNLFLLQTEVFGLARSCALTYPAARRELPAVAFLFKASLLTLHASEYQQNCAKFLASRFGNIFERLAATSHSVVLPQQPFEECRSASLGGEVAGEEGLEAGVEVAVGGPEQAPRCRHCLVARHLARIQVLDHLHTPRQGDSHHSECVLCCMRKAVVLLCSRACSRKHCASFCWCCQSQWIQSAGIIGMPLLATHEAWNALQRRAA